tara:strand:+ start:324 stop:896 length:573 start_codon:yes stop_codon:yes gene_type:complete
MSTNNSFNYRGLGGALSIGSTFTNIIAARSAADTERYKLESQGLNYELQSNLADLNADMLTLEAQQVARAYNRQIMTKTLQDGLKKGTARASFAARGIQMGVGSTANVFATSAIMKEIDKLTMNSNKVRAVNQMKTRGVQADIRGDMLGVSASNMFASATTVSPFLNMASTLLTGAADFAANEGYGFFKK